MDNKGRKMKRQRNIRLFISLLVFAWVVGVGPQIFDFPPGIQKAHAAVPTVVASGAVTNGINARTPALPAGIATDDILLLFI